MSNAQLKVTVVYVEPDVQFLRELIVDLGTTAGEVVALSGLLEEVPDLDASDLGVFGKPVGPDRELRHGDRVEVYRPLIIEPMEARRRRAERSKQ